MSSRFLVFQGPKNLLSKSLYSFVTWTKPVSRDGDSGSSSGFGSPIESYREMGRRSLIAPTLQSVSQTRTLGKGVLPFRYEKRPKEVSLSKSVVGISRHVALLLV